MNKIGRIFRNRKLLILVAIVLVATLFLIVRVRGNIGRRSVETAEVGSGTRAVASIGKAYTFKAVNANRESVSVKFTLTSAERKDEITVKGESRKLKNDKDYLLLRIEIENNRTERVAIATADFIRLEGEEGKLFAPDYHNGNVVVDPLSVRKDIVSFVVGRSAKSFVIQVGELSGEKEKIEVKF